MDEVTAILARDFGLRPQGKAAPMSASKTGSAGGAALRSGSAMSSPASSSWSDLRSGPIPNSGSDPFLGDYGFGMSSSRSQPDFDDIFGGPPVKTNPTAAGSSSSSSYPPPVFDSLLGDFEDFGAKSSSLPAHKEPVFGGSDLFDAVPGPGSNGSSFGYDDVFFSVPSKSNDTSKPMYKDFHEDLGNPVRKSKSMNVERPSNEKVQNLSRMDDLIPGFGGSSSMKKRGPPRASQQKASVASAKPPTGVVEDPFLLFETKETQTKETHDLESFFSVGARASSVPKRRPTVESMFDVQVQNKGGHDGMKPSSSSPSFIRKASSASNFVHDFSSIWGDPPSSGKFEEIEGESEERRRARFERHLRTEGRMAKALAEKAERDMQNAQEQAERHNIAGAIEIDIKRWAAGKEGNIRAMLSSLQYILWPECRWQPVSLTDLITSDAVKKVYRKANLCIHPDKVQQKGATVEQKYIAEKVFDLLKEAFKKFSSEELR